MHKRTRLILTVLLCLVLLAGGWAFLRRENRWTVTCYASVTGGQSMFYTITDRRGYFFHCGRRV